MHRRSVGLLRVGQHVAIGIAAEAVGPPGSINHHVGDLAEELELMRLCWLAAHRPVPEGDPGGVVEHWPAAVGETLILLHPPLHSLHLVCVSVGMERRCQQNDSLANTTGLPAARPASMNHLLTCPRAGWISMLLLEWLRNPV